MSFFFAGWENLNQPRVECMADMEWVFTMDFSTNNGSTMPYYLHHSILSCSLKYRYVFFLDLTHQRYTMYVLNFIIHLFRWGSIYLTWPSLSLFADHGNIPVQKWKCTYGKFSTNFRKVFVITRPHLNHQAFSHPLQEIVSAPSFSCNYIDPSTGGVTFTFQTQLGNNILTGTCLDQFPIFVITLSSMSW